MRLHVYLKFYCDKHFFFFYFSGWPNGCWHTVQRDVQSLFKEWFWTFSLGNIFGDALKPIVRSGQLLELSRHCIPNILLSIQRNKSTFSSSTADCTIDWQYGAPFRSMCFSNVHAIDVYYLFFCKTRSLFYGPWIAAYKSNF